VVLLGPSERSPRMLRVRGPSLWRKLRRKAGVEGIVGLRPEFELHMIQALVDEGVPEPIARQDIAKSHGAWARDIGRKRR
jgi:hypothetical protein